MDRHTVFTKEALDQLREKGPQVVPLMYHGRESSVEVGKVTVEVDDVGLRITKVDIPDAENYGSFLMSLQGGLKDISIGEVESGTT